MPSVSRTAPDPSRCSTTIESSSTHVVGLIDLGRVQPCRTRKIAPVHQPDQGLWPAPLPYLERRLVDQLARLEEDTDPAVPTVEGEDSVSRHVDDRRGRGEFTRPLTTATDRAFVATVGTEETDLLGHPVGHQHTAVCREHQISDPRERVLWIAIERADLKVVFREHAVHGD
jgi:hypothetical protein